jgi:hypothetical protein
MQANLVFKDPRFPYIFTFTDVYMPDAAYISYRSKEAIQYYVYKSVNGWNPGVTASNQGLIGFNFSKIPGFAYGDTYQIISSAGTVNVFNYTPLSALEWSPSSETITWSGYDGSDVVNQSQFATIPFSAVTDIIVGSEANLYSIKNFTSYQNLSALTILDCSRNTFSAVDIQNNIDLINLYIARTPNLQILPMYLCSNIEYLYITVTGLEYLDLTPNISITQADLYYNNKLNTVVLPSTLTLTDLYLNNCALSSINVVACSALNNIVLNDNSLQTSAVDTVINNLSLNGVSNGYLNITNNFPRSSASDVGYTNLINRSWTVEVDTLAPLSWSLPTTTIAWSGYNGSGDFNVYQFSAIPYSDITDIYVDAGKDLSFIRNFAGYQSLTALTILENTNPSFTEINVRNSLELTSLIIDQCNYLTSISINLCSNLKYLLLSFNLLTELDLTLNTALTEAEIYNNDNLTSITLPSVGTLSAIYFYSNSLSSINVSDCPALTIIDLSNNVLTTSAVDTVLIDLNDNGASNGNLDISNNSPRSSASDIAFNSLTAKNWDIVL